MSKNATERGEVAVNELFHYGVPGMKWGVRRAQKAQAKAAKAETKLAKASVKTDKASAKLAKASAKQASRQAKASKTAYKAGKKTTKADAKWEKKVEKKAYTKASKKASARMNVELNRINNKPEYKDLDFSVESPARRKYFAELSNTMTRLLNEEAAKFGTNTSGTKELKFEFYNFETDTAPLARIVEVDGTIRHDDTGSVVDVTVEWSSEGYLLSIETEGEVEMSDMTAAQRGEKAASELFHYGVKGMKWGVRNNPDGSVTVDQTRVKKSLRNAKDVTVTQRKAGTYVKAKGGQRQKASDDAVRTQANRQKAKKSTTDALSNRELKATIERMRLEQEYAKLNKKVSRKGKNFISRLLQSPEARATTKDLLQKVARENS